ncbi:MAG: cobalt transporter CbiM [Peptococcaceae bacterium]|nr:cobalt transporter CbiM [Peptococcaceae bacterium]
MHIPDGYLSPQTCGTLGVASAIVAAGASYKTAKTLKAKYIPLLSIGSAFAFLIMMFNVPIPDGTTAHAVGGGLLAVVLGPWAAFISITIALVIQALFFGDGGILALGANVFNMAFILPFVAYGIYRLIAGRSQLTAKRRWLAAGIGGYVGINLAALAAGIELGLQPLLFHAADGTPLYNPYGLSVAVPAMSLAHLLVAGPVEAVVTGLVVAYLQKTSPQLLELRNSTANTANLNWRKLIPVGVLLVLLVPVGLLAPGTAWGEWGTEAIKAKLGYVPMGMQKFADLWKPLMPGYGISGLGQNFWQQAVGYIAAAIVGVILILLIAVVVRRFGAKGDKKHGPSDVAPRK